MTFVSLEFLIFFPIIISVNFLLKSRFRIIFLTIISFYYYLTFMRQYALVLLFLVIICYLLSLLYLIINHSIHRRILFSISLLSLISILIYFKYTIFIFDNISIITGVKFNLFTSPFIFIGISYIVFQLIGYYIDIFYNRIEVETNFFCFLLFILYFPKIISGPIEKGSKLLPQFHNISDFDYKSFIEGFKIFIYGFFFKVVLADRLAIAVNKVFETPGNFNSLQILVSILFYSLQIYSDFLSYSYMAVGASKMLGFNITNNFHLPFFSQSIGEFWKRWHISLSQWLRDYLFLPLSYLFIRKYNSMNLRLGKAENYSYIFSTFITMIICGLWHGPKWTFVVWGLLHALYLIISFLTRKLRKRMLKSMGFKTNNIFLRYLRMIFVFIIITLAFVFFRANSINEAMIILEGLFKFNSHYITSLYFNVNDLYIVIFTIFIVFLIENHQYNSDNNEYKYQIFELLNTPMVITLLLLIIFLGKFGESDFIYFKF